MFVPSLILRNAIRHKLRTTLTMVGIVVAIVAFGLLRTIVDAWYAGAEATSSARLVTRNSISLVFPLPFNYAQKIRQVEGVSAVAGGNWFGGVYITEGNFFPQFAIDPAGYFDMYPEFRLPPDELKSSTVRARSRAARSPTSKAGRSATRFRCGERSIRARGRSRCAVFTTAPTPRSTRPSSSSTGIC